MHIISPFDMQFMWSDNIFHRYSDNQSEGSSLRSKSRTLCSFFGSIISTWWAWSVEKTMLQNLHSCMMVQQPLWTCSSGCKIRFFNGRWPPWLLDVSDLGWGIDLPVEVLFLVFDQTGNSEPDLYTWCPWFFWTKPWTLSIKALWTCIIEVLIIPVMCEAVLFLGDE